MILPPFDRRAVPPGLRFHDLAVEGGWRLRGYDWPAVDGSRPRGSILFQSGRADFIEKYFEALGHWHDRGWAIAGFDWRGQGGSTRGDSGIPGGATLEAMTGDLAGETARWIARTPAPHVVIGHSMGGHLLLRLLAEHHLPIAAAVLAAPMLGLAHAPLPAWLARQIAAGARMIGLGDASPWSGAAQAVGRQARLTACVDRYADEGWWRAEKPALAVDPVTWGWLDQAMRSIARLDRPGVLEAVEVPVLLLAAEQDRLVSVAAVRVAATRLPHARLVMLDGAHELLREADPVRGRAFAAIDGFLDEKAPPA